MSAAADMTAIFLDVFSGLPRQGPGSDETTLKALALCDGLPDAPHIADIGCGSGMQTLALAQATGGKIIAVDYHQPILDELIAQLASHPLADQITPQQGDMTALDFDENQFDLIWSEGAVYIMGMTEALTAWRAFLKPDGLIAFSHIVWITDERPQAIEAYWQTNYPKITTIAHNLEQIASVGYDVLGHFTVPADDWWSHFYTHLETKLPALNQKYVDNESAQNILAEVRHELAIRREYGAYFSYEFYVCRPTI